MSSWVNKLARPPTIPGSINVKSAEIEKIKNIENNNILFRGLVRVATTNNIELKGFQLIDGMPVNSNNLVLVKNQTNKIENGVYRVSQNNWTRSKLLLKGVVGTSLTFLIREGSSNAKTMWSCSNSLTQYVGTDPTIFFKVVDNEGGGSSDTIILKKNGDDNIQWKFQVNTDNDLQFYYSNDNGNTFIQKYIFSD